MTTPLSPSALRRAAVAVTTTAATAGLLLVGAGSASAHVRVVPDTTSAGGYAKLTFNVPNESATAATARIQVDLPTATPFTSVSVKPVEGWTAKLTTTTLPKPVDVDGTTVTKAVTSVVWTADDAAHRIDVHEYQAFALSVGKLPAEGTTVTLPTTQSYTDGTVARWNQPAQGDAEPESPAPAFTTTTAEQSHHGAAAGAASGATSGSQADAAHAEPASVTTASSSAGAWGLGLGAAGFVLGAAALVVALRTHWTPRPVRATAGQREAGR